MNRPRELYSVGCCGTGILIFDDFYVAEGSVFDAGLLNCSIAGLCKKFEQIVVLLQCSVLFFLVLSVGELFFLFPLFTPWFTPLSFV